VTYTSGRSHGDEHRRGERRPQRRADQMGVAIASNATPAKAKAASGRLACLYIT
jgi:hypothetical protein